MAWHGDRYVIQYSDAVAFEHLFAGQRLGGRQLDVRRIKPGVAHVVLPGHLADHPEKAVRWLEKLVQSSTG